MNLLLRKINTSDKELLNSWAILWGAIIAPLEYWPPEGGYMVEGDGQPLFASWVYPSGETAWLEGLLSNPSISKEDRRNALTFMIGCIETEARRQGCRRVICTPEKASVQNMLLKAQWSCLPFQVYYLYKELE